MANATPAAARTGWQLFRLSGFQDDLKTINGRLHEAGYGPVSKRMHNHYRSLAAAGYDHYVPINRFDIARASEPFEGDSATNRYSYVDSRRPLTLTFIRDGHPVEVQGQSRLLSEIGLTVNITGKGRVAGLRQLGARPGEYVAMDMPGPDESLHGRLIGPPEFGEEKALAILDIEFTRLHSVTEFSDFEPLASSQWNLKLAAEDGGALGADVFGRRIYYLLELVEISRSMVNEVLASEAQAAKVRATPPGIERLEMDSPIEVTFVGAAAVFGIPLSIFGLIRSGIWAWQKVEDARLTRASGRRERAEAERVELGNKKLREENDTLTLLHTMARSSIQDSGQPLGDAKEPSNRLRQLTTRDLPAALEGLARQGVTDLESLNPSNED